MKLYSAVLAVTMGLALTACDESSKAAKAEVTEAAPKTEAAKPAAEAPKAPAAEGRLYTFSQEGSKIGFKGAKVTGSHLGGFNSFKGEIKLPGTKPEEGSVKLTIQTDSVFSDAEKLTGHLKSPDFFDVAKYPEATFASTAIAAEADGKYKVTGDLTLHGVTKQISFPATIQVEGDTVKATSEFSINRKDFGIVYPGMPDDLIRDDVVIMLDVTAKPAGSAPTAEAEAAPTTGATGAVPAGGSH